MLTDANFEDLKVKGYTVVRDVLTSEECDTAIGQYREWLSQFQDGSWPVSYSSLIMRYNTGHMTPTWFVRLRARKVFAQLWKTDKLLSSVDAIAIGRPPEDGQEDFYDKAQSWLHLDQTPSRVGLHAYQGSVYLEEAAIDDWTMEVMEGSHLPFQKFFEKNRDSAAESEKESFYMLMPWEVQQYKDNGCPVRRVPCPKGGMVLWDSRLVHANAKPVEGRQHPGRWRFCNFVSMTPAIWANQKELENKQKAYSEVRMTTHWSSQGIGLFQSDIPKGKGRSITFPTELPDIAKTEEAKQLSGVIPYDFNDGRPNGEEMMPKWSSEEFRNRRFDQSV